MAILGYQVMEMPAGDCPDDAWIEAANQSIRALVDVSKDGFDTVTCRRATFPDVVVDLSAGGLIQIQEDTRGNTVAPNPVKCIVVTDLSLNFPFTLVCDGQVVSSNFAAGQELQFVTCDPFADLAIQIQGQNTPFSQTVSVSGCISIVCFDKKDTFVGDNVRVPRFRPGCNYGSEFINMLGCAVNALCTKYQTQATGYECRTDVFNDLSNHTLQVGVNADSVMLVMGTISFCMDTPIYNPTSGSGPDDLQAQLAASVNVDLTPVFVCGTRRIKCASKRIFVEATISGSQRFCGQVCFSACFNCPEGSELGVEINQVSTCAGVQFGELDPDLGNIDVAQQEYCTFQWFKEPSNVGPPLGAFFGGCLKRSYVLDLITKMNNLEEVMCSAVDRACNLVPYYALDQDPNTEAVIVPPEPPPTPPLAIPSRCMWLCGVIRVSPNAEPIITDDQNTTTYWRYRYEIKCADQVIGGNEFTPWLILQGSGDAFSDPRQFTVYHCISCLSTDPVTINVIVEGPDTVVWDGIFQGMWF